jgi:hypothetical protein
LAELGGPRRRNRRPRRIGGTGSAIVIGALDREASTGYESPPFAMRPQEPAQWRMTW